MTPEQKTAFDNPCDSFDVDAAVKPHKFENGFVSVIIVDANPNSPDKWPCWQANVFYMLGHWFKGKQPISLTMWDVRREQAAHELIRSQLSGVGTPESDVLYTVEDMIAGARVLNAEPGCGICGRRRMTAAEVRECFAEKKEMLHRLNPKIQLLDG